jgi:hypothetical protein
MSKKMHLPGAGPRFPLDRVGIVSLALAAAFVIIALELSYLLL